MRKQEIVSRAWQAGRSFRLTGLLILMAASTAGEAIAQAGHGTPGPSSGAIPGTSG